MNYLLKNNKRERGIQKHIVGAFAILALVAIFYLVGRGVIGNGLWVIAQPLIYVEKYASGVVSGLAASVENKSNLENQNAALRQELQSAQASLQTLDFYKTENEKLKEMLGRTSGGKRVVAAILAKPNRSLYDTLVLDAGINQGATVGDRVFSGDFVIGTVREVNSGTSKVTLFSAPGETANVLIGNTNISVEAEGLGNGNFSVKLPKEIPVAQGDLIRMPGLNPKFFGTVTNVEQTAASSFQFILFSLPVNVNSISWVEILEK